MIRRGRSSSRLRTSGIAQSWVDDGDDLHMTPSFLPSEENSSVVGNASVAPSTSVHEKPSEYPFFDVERESENRRDNDMENSSVQSTACEGGVGENSRERSKSFNILRERTKDWKKPQKFVLPRRIKRFISPAKGPLSHHLPIHPKNGTYQEMLEDPTEHHNPSNLDESMRSIRSTRIDVGTGRSMLVRQNAQVKGRPSVAQQQWDVGSVVSSTGSSASNSSISSRRSKRNITWNNADNSVRSDISRLTGDSSLNSKRSPYSMSRAMYMGPNPDNNFLLGATEEEEEEEAFEMTSSQNDEFFKNLSHMPQASSTNHTVHDENRDDVGEGDRMLTETVVLATLDDLSQISELNVLGSHSDDKLFSPRAGIMRGRERVMSDSEFLLEMQRRKLRFYKDDARILESYNCEPRGQDGLAISPRLVVPGLSRTASYSDFLFPPTETNSDHIQKQRCLSESNMEEIMVDVLEKKAVDRYLDDFDYNISRDGARNSTSAATATKELHRLLKENTSKLQILALPGFRRGQARRLEGAELDSIPLLSDSEYASKTPTLISDSSVSVFEEGGMDDEEVNKQMLRTSGSPENIGDITSRSPLQVLSRVSSATVSATNAAKMIASVIRPPVASIMPMRSSKAHDYYWNTGDDESDGDASGQILWSLSEHDSFEDIF